MSSPRSTATIRRATYADLGNLLELMREFYAESSYPLDETWAASAFAPLLERSELGCVWLAESDGGAAGHAVLTLRYSMEHGTLSGQIDDLFVRPAFRRRRIGHALLSELFDECRQRSCKAVYVEVGERNAAALELYRRFGLEPFRDGRVLLHCALGPAT
jgi:ribosomal protein S18 acetylase RimI-like enzyme